jgi:hypothetical protein
LVARLRDFDAGACLRSLVSLGFVGTEDSTGKLLFCLEAMIV